MKTNTFLKTKKGSHILLEAAACIAELITQKEPDMLQEILFYLIDVFDGADISLFDMEREIFLATTILEGEEMESASHFASCLKMTDSVRRMSTLSLRLPAKFREHILLIEQYPIKFGQGRYFLLCEYNKIFKPKDEHFAELFLSLLSIALGSYELGMDVAKDTKLRGREELINVLEHPLTPLPCDKSLAVIALRDARMLNKELGHAQVDEYLAFIKATLVNHYGAKVYRIGGTKFAVLFFDPVYDIHGSVIEILDRFIEKDIPVAAVLTPVEDIYSAIFLCETYLKKVQPDSVVVVREKGNQAELASSEQLSEIYLKKAFATVTEEGKDVADESVEVINIDIPVTKRGTENTPCEVPIFEGGNDG